MTTTTRTDIDGNAIFARPCTPSNGYEGERFEGRDLYAILTVDDGLAVTGLPGCWPDGSDLSGSYEHPEGIILDREQVKRLGIEIED